VHGKAMKLVNTSRETTWRDSAIAWCSAVEHARPTLGEGEQHVWELERGGGLREGAGGKQRPGLEQAGSCTGWCS
jgi:hypothetical protein